MSEIQKSKYACCNESKMIKRKYISIYMFMKNKQETQSILAGRC